MRLDIFLPLGVTGRIVSIAGETSPVLMLFLGTTGHTIGPIIALVVGARVGVIVVIMAMAAAVDVV